jgi:hypothetical protein
MIIPKSAIYLAKEKRACNEALIWLSLPRTFEELVIKQPQWASWSLYYLCGDQANKAYDEATATAKKAYDEATATAKKAYDEATATASKAFYEAIATATANKAYDEVTANKAFDGARDTASKVYNEAKFQALIEILERELGNQKEAMTCG